MSGETAPVDPETFLQLALSTRSAVPPRPTGFDMSEADAIIDRALQANRRLADEIEQARRRAIDAALGGGEGPPVSSPATAGAEPVAPEREPGGYPSGPPPAFTPPPPVVPKWEPTHVVPSGGLPAWRDPNPAVPPTTDLRPQLPVRVLRVANGWAQVKTAIGRTWWVDAARLVQIDRPR